MRLMPDQIPNPFHFLAEYHERVVPLFMQHIQLFLEANPDLHDSSEPCWLWKGPMRKPDLPPDLASYYVGIEEMPDPEELESGKVIVKDHELFHIRREPVFDLSTALTEDEKFYWNPGQLLHLVVNPQLVAWSIRKEHSRLPYDPIDPPRYYSTCVMGECLQGWHLIPTTVLDERRRLRYQDACSKVNQRYDKRKRVMQVALANAARHGHATNNQRGGPQLVVGSPEYVRLETRISLSDTQRQKALKRLERRLFKHPGLYDGNAFPALEPSQGAFRERILRAADNYLDRSGDCWIPFTDVVNPISTHPVVTFEGRTSSLLRALFVLTTGQSLPKNSILKRSCTTSYCHTPAHRTVQVK